MEEIRPFQNWLQKLHSCPFYNFVCIELFNFKNSHLSVIYFIASWFCILFRKFLSLLFYFLSNLSFFCYKLIWTSFIFSLEQFFEFPWFFSYSYYMEVFLPTLVEEIPTHICCCHMALYCVRSCATYFHMHNLIWKMRFSCENT